MKKTLCTLLVVFGANWVLYAAEPDVPPAPAETDGETHLIDVPYFENGKFKGYSQVPIVPDRTPSSIDASREENTEVSKPIDETSHGEETAVSVDHD